tara:strand:+ start:294 stop:500 length:207 start_codon:yes stop_codon:yes gene_type:complete
MIKEIKHKETGMVITAQETKEIRECGSFVYNIKGYFAGKDCSRISIELYINEYSMKDFEITYKTFDCF